MQKISIWVFLLIVFPIVVSAQPHQYNFSHVDIKQGLSHNQVNSIYKDKDGFIWFGTLAGLNRFDGYDFKVYKHDVNDTTSIIDDFIIKITDGPEGNLWIFTRNGVSVYQPRTEKFIRDANQLFKK